jgi:hypothetical protein
MFEGLEKLGREADKAQEELIKASQDVKTLKICVLVWDRFLQAAVEKLAEAVSPESFDHSSRVWINPPPNNPAYLVVRVDDMIGVMKVFRDDNEWFMSVENVSDTELYDILPACLPLGTVKPFVDEIVDEYGSQNFITLNLEELSGEHMSRAMLVGCDENGMDWYFDEARSRVFCKGDPTEFEERGYLCHSFAAAKKMLKDRKLP